MVGSERNGEGEKKGGVVKEEKEREQSAVPTAGAFYMHDDRFRGDSGFRQRRIPGGCKLWESKDDHAWVHDRFEEMNLQEVHYNEERRTYRGRYRGRGNIRLYGRGMRYQLYDDRLGANKDMTQAHDGRHRGYGEKPRFYNDRSRAYDDTGTQNHGAPKSVSGRGLRRGEFLLDKKEVPETRNKQNPKLHKSAFKNATGRHSSEISVSQNDADLSQKQVIASSLNYASPPFYPFGNSNQDLHIAPNKGAQAGQTDRNLTSSILENKFLSPSTSSLLKKKCISGHVSRKMPQMDDSLHHIAVKSVANLPPDVSGSSSSTLMDDSQQRVPGRRSAIVGGQLNHRQNSSASYIGRGSPAQLPAVQQRSVQTQVQPAAGSFAQQSGQHPAGRALPSSAHQSINASESEFGESEFPVGSSTCKTLIAGKDKVGNQGGIRGTFLYDGAQFIGANGALGFGIGDQGFPGTPALLPVMQFSGQHPGVPAVGMALPGYVTQRQLSSGSSEMAWVPMLAGAAGVLGASYGPYIALDGGYHSPPAGQATSAISKEISSMKSGSSSKPSQTSESENDEFVNRQNKPRRYSEMNFGQ